MTDKAYYEKGFDIVSARERFFGKREMCERYVIRFLEDPNYEEMIKAIREKDTEQAFHYAHTLKGVCANLSLWRMQDAVSGVVEGLRMGKLPREEEISDLEKCYQKTVVWVNLVKEQGITDFQFWKNKIRDKKGQQ